MLAPKVDRDKRVLLQAKHNSRKSSGDAGRGGDGKEAKWGKGRGGKGPGMQEALKRESERWDPD
jgi:hypothetical protein